MKAGQKVGQKKGFTIIELIFVIVMLSILGSVAVNHIDTTESEPQTQEAQQHQQYQQNSQVVNQSEGEQW